MLLYAAPVSALLALAAANRAAHNHIPPGLAIAVALVALAVVYVIACAIWPFAACSRCKGAAKFRSPSGKAWRTCRRCKGSGARLRYGRHAWNYLRRTSANAHRGDKW